VALIDNRAGEGRIVVYEIGARNGARHFAESYCRFPESLAHDMFTIFFEADESAIAQIEQRNDPALTQALGICLGAHDGSGTLHVNYDPYTSSLLKPSANEGFEFTIEGTMDYVHREVLAPAREVSVEMRAIDGLVGEGLPPPTVLFLDTQGTELDILRGGRRAIEEHAVAIVTEAEFLPFYEGQPLFGDLCRELAEMGFIFAHFVGSLEGIDPFHVPLGFRNRTFVGSCDALFLRVPRAEEVESGRVARLGLIAHCFGQGALAFRCLSMLEKADPKLESIPDARGYKAFLVELLAAQRAMAHYFPPKFTDLYPTAEVSAARFSVSGGAAAEALQQEALQRVGERLLKGSEELQQLLASSPSPLEAVLQKYGFVERAAELQKRRVEETTAMLSSYGIRIERH